jgi:hypothetical protein
MAITVDSGSRYEGRSSSAAVKHSVRAGETLAEVREAEATHLAERRILVGRRAFAGVEEDPTPESVASSAVGLTLSGGGIRSATTNLGVLQARAKSARRPVSLLRRTSDPRSRRGDAALTDRPDGPVRHVTDARVILEIFCAAAVAAAVLAHPRLLAAIVVAPISPLEERSPIGVHDHTVPSQQKCFNN